VGTLRADRSRLEDLGAVARVLHGLVVPDLVHLDREPAARARDRPAKGDLDAVGIAAVGVIDLGRIVANVTDRRRFIGAVLRDGKGPLIYSNAAAEREETPRSRSSSRSFRQTPPP
jgi:hypothetical protein